MCERRGKREHDAPGERSTQPFIIVHCQPWGNDPPGDAHPRRERVSPGDLIHTSRMTVSRLRVAKSETRDMAEHDRIVRQLETSE
jgi:hypothetical protein